MKRFISVILALVMIFCALPTEIIAVGIDEVGELLGGSSGIVDSGYCGTMWFDGKKWTYGTNLKWVLTDDDTLTVDGNGYMVNATIFETPWKKYTPTIKAIVVEDGVTDIGDGVFAGCISLSSVKISVSVKYIGIYAFEHCTSLTSIVIPNSVTSIEDWAFLDCSSLTSIIIPNSVTSVGQRAFAGCRSLTSITIPDSVTSISYDAFDDCESLTDIYCEAESKPDGWDNDWLGNCTATVHWGYKGGDTPIVPPDNPTLEFNGHTYKIVDAGITWTEANEECEKMGGHLVTISSAEEQNFVQSQFDSNSKNCYWMGGRYVDNSWSWITTEPFSYQNWGINEPNNEEGQEAFLHMYGQNRTSYLGEKKVGQWNDASNNGAAYADEFYRINNFGFICEWDNQGNTPNPGDDETVYTHFGKLDPHGYGVDTIKIDGVTYNMSEAFKNSGSNFGMLWPDNYMNYYYYAAYSLNGNNEIIAFKLRTGEDWKLESYDSATKTVKLSRMENGIRIINDYKVSQAAAKHFPYNEIEQWIGDKVRAYIIGDYIYEAVHIECATGNVEAVNTNTYPHTVRVGGVDYAVCDTPDLNGIVEKLEIGDEIDITMFDKQVIYILTFIQPSPPIVIPSNFNIYTFQARHIKQSYVKNLVTGDYSQKILIDNIKPTHLDELYGTWDSVTTVVDGIIKNPTGIITHVTADKVDMYEAIILSALMVDFDTSVTDVLNSIINNSKAKATKEIVNIFKQCEDIQIYDRIANQMENLSDDEIKEIKNKICNSICNSVFGKEYGDAADELINGKIMGVIGDAMSVCDTVESFGTTMLSYSKVLQLTQEMKSVIISMYEHCEGNWALKQALGKCVDVIENGMSDFLAREGSIVILNEAYGALLDEIWKESVIKCVVAKAPIVGELIAIYKSGKSLVNLVYNLDAQKSAFNDCVAAAEFSALIEDEWSIRGKDAYTTETGAKAYMETLRLLHNSRVNELDKVKGYFNTVYNKNLFGKIVLPGKKYEALAASIDKLKENIVSQSTYSGLFDDSWMDALNDEYPELYKALMKNKVLQKKTTKKVKVACPVNVYCYDGENKLVAYVEDGIVHVSKNVAIILNGEEKTFVFNDEQNYRIVSKGYDIGTMDICVTEYSDNDVSRTVNYFDIPVEHSSTATLSENNDDYTLTDNSNNLIAPNYDSNVPTAKYTLTINGGYIHTNNTFEYTVEASAGEIVDITAYVPSGKEFHGWRSTSGTAPFENASEISTQFIVPASNVDINADITILTSHTHTITQDEGTSATCQHEGRTPGTHCLECGENLSGNEIIAIAGHNYVNGVCSDCGQTNGNQGVHQQDTYAFVFLNDTHHSMLINGVMCGVSPHVPDAIGTYLSETHKWHICSVCGHEYGRTEITPDETFDIDIPTEVGNDSVTIEIAEPLEAGFVEAEGENVLGSNSTKQEAVVVLIVLAVASAAIVIVEKRVKK